MLFRSDSGTCITYNYVSAEGVFLGGNISPGLEMRFNGLHRFTARLPLVTPTETLTHASRGAARCSNTLVATGARVRNAYATYP